MKCPKCSAYLTDVYNSRSAGSGFSVWRRRRCRTCTFAFTTYEAVEIGAIVRVNSVPYQRARLYRSLLKSFESDLGKIDQVENIIAVIELKLLQNRKQAITSAELVMLVLSTLKSLSFPAYAAYVGRYAPSRIEARGRTIKL